MPTDVVAARTDRRQDDHPSPKSSTLGAAVRNSQRNAKASEGEAIEAAVKEAAASGFGLGPIFPDAAILGGRRGVKDSYGGEIDGGAVISSGAGGSAMRDAASTRRGISPRGENSPQRGQAPPLIEVEGTWTGSVRSHAEQINAEIRSGRARGAVSPSKPIAASEAGSPARRTALPLMPYDDSPRRRQGPCNQPSPLRNRGAIARTSSVGDPSSGLHLPRPSESDASPASPSVEIKALKLERVRSTIDLPIETPRGR